jgi:Gpi18-like mannosyltransferase
MPKPRTPYVWLTALLLAAALAVRLWLFPHISHDFETFLRPWVQTFRDYGPLGGFTQDFSDYNMPYLYILSLLSLLPSGTELYAIKAVSVLFDVLLAFAAHRLCRVLGGDDRRALLAFALSLFAPTAFLNSGMWAQCDSLYAALLLLALADALGRRPWRSLALSGLAFSFKLQTIFLLPVYLLFWLAKRVKFRHFFAFPAAYALSILPALAFGKPLGEILRVYVRQTGQFSAYLNLNAPSVFAFLPREPENPKLWFWLGIFAAALWIALLCLYAYRSRGRLAQEDAGLEWLLLAYLLAAGIPFLLPSMHDRYFYVAEQLALVLAVLRPKKLWPVALLTQAAGYGGYHAYLFRAYLFPGGMAVPALLMLAAVALAANFVRTHPILKKS